MSNLPIAKTSNLEDHLILDEPREVECPHCGQTHTVYESDNEGEYSCDCGGQFRTVDIISEL